MLLQYLQTVAVISKGKSTQRSNTKKGMLLLVGCITSHHHFSISQDGCAQTILSAATLIEAVDVTCYLVQSQYTDMGLISPSVDPVTPDAWQGSHWSTNFKLLNDNLEKDPQQKQESNPGLPLSRWTHYQ